MGPCGNGKSTLGRALADALGIAFIEGDDLHPAENIARMSRGEPLTDEHRAPFLDAVGARLQAAEGGAVVSCSALKRAYRDRIAGLCPTVQFIWPDVPRAELERRMAARTDHFMPPSMLESQLAVFEPPAGEAWATRIDGNAPVERQLAELALTLAE